MGLYSVIEFLEEYCSRQNDRAKVQFSRSYIFAV